MPRRSLSIAACSAITALTTAAPSLGAKSAASATRAATSCPAETPGTNRVLRKYVTDPGLTSFRYGEGVYGMDMSEVRLLTDARDAAVCQKILATVQIPQNVPRDVAIYTGRSHYFVVSANTTTKVITYAPLVVLDATYKVLDVLAM